MPHAQVEIPTPDGPMPTHLLTPEGAGPWPAVIMYMDALGMRPALVEIAERIAAAGYLVVLPELFHRIGYTADEGKRLFATREGRAEWRARVLPAASAANAMRDTGALLAWLDARDDVRHGAVDITGYCMGGRLALYAAGHFGARVAAAAAYHPGGVATDAADSPHRLAAQVRARVYVGRATDDGDFDDAALERLERALTEARVAHEIETYPARHGWVPRDTPSHDPVQAERHWTTLLALFGETLGR